MPSGQVLEGAVPLRGTALVVPCPPPSGWDLRPLGPYLRRRVSQPFQAASALSDRASRHIFRIQRGRAGRYACTLRLTLPRHVLIAFLQLLGPRDKVKFNLRLQPINLMSFQNVAQELQEVPIGFSTRVHVIGTGKVLDWSVEENHAIPGKFELLHTQPPDSRSRGPYVSAGNPGASRKSP